MGIELFLTFVTIITALFLSPGPSVLLTINNGIKYGAKVACAGVMGNIVAFQILVLLSTMGLGTILAASSDFFIVLKICGAAYLIYLGFKIWFDSVPQHTIEPVPKQKTKHSLHLFKEALFVSLSNPKGLVFVSALLPQFIDVNHALLPQIALISLTTATVHFIIYQSYAALSSKATYLLENPTNRTILNRISGAIFASLGIALGLSESTI